MEILLLAIVTSSAIYLVLSYLFREPRVPLLTAVFIACNILSRSPMFRTLIPRVSRHVDELLGPTKPVENRLFDRLSETSRAELIQAVHSLRAYSSEFRKANERRRRLFRLMSWRQQKLCEDVGYLAKLKKMDTLVRHNQEVLASAASHAISHYGLTYHDLQGASPANNAMYRVVETLSHFVRDWCDYGLPERQPLMDYIKTQLDNLVPESERGNTCVVVPGSGVGGVAHEIALMGFAEVHAVEFSGLMHVANQFVYANEGSSIYPAVHGCSNFRSPSDQYRSIQLAPQEMPANLSLHLADFRYFSHGSGLDNVVVVTAFFMDTAENLLDYLDSLERLTKNAANGYWINVGPLKYGTAAQVELSASEFASLRKKMGWTDVDSRNSLDGEGLVGYATDRESMWQGFYGLEMWASKRAH